METATKFCSRCGKQRPVEGHRRCKKCQVAAREWERKKRVSIPPGICSRCGKRHTFGGYLQCDYCRQISARGMLKWRTANTEHAKSYQREWNRKRRKSVIEHYGGKCECCGESTFEFLALDHKDGGGDQHRRKVGQGSLMVDWILKNNFPEIFQVLCHNCNQAIGYYGSCPHQMS